jgi:hypothetical protein
VRWPLRWPCKAVYAPDVLQCPHLRALVEELWSRPNFFQPYVARFQLGPFELEHQMAEKLDRVFGQFPTLPNKHFKVS